MSDKKLGTDNTGDGKADLYVAQVQSATDYYPFGWEMPGRVFSSGSYEFGFNGQMKSPEIADGHYTADHWEYDSRIGRRWNLDPVVQSHISGYAAFNNNPIFFLDSDGDIGLPAIIAVIRVIQVVYRIYKATQLVRQAQAARKLAYSGVGRTPAPPPIYGPYTLPPVTVVVPRPSLTPPIQTVIPGMVATEMLGTIPPISAAEIETAPGGFSAPSEDLLGDPIMEIWKSEAEKLISRGGVFTPKEQEIVDAYLEKRKATWHGNTAGNQLTEVYNLVARVGGALKKIGETIHGVFKHGKQKRYTQAELDEMDVDYVPKTVLPKKDGRKLETKEIQDYTKKHGKRPDLNKNDH